MKKNKILLVVPIFQKEKIFFNVLKKIKNIYRTIITECLIIADEPDEETKSLIKSTKFNYIINNKRKGVGSAIRCGINYAKKNNFNIIVIMAANGKDNPLEIEKLLKPILTENYDYVQGSRYLKGGSFKNTPLIRIIQTKLMTLIWNILTHSSCTDISNGFRAYKLSIFNNSVFNLKQKWLDKYEMEYYIHYKILTNNFKFKEVPVSKIYYNNKKYTKIKIQDCIKIALIVFYLKFGFVK